MSGEKDTIVNLRQSEYNRMMRSCNRVDNLESGIRSNMQRMAGNLREELNGRISAINKRHSNIETHLSSMSEEMRQIEQEQNRQIRDQAREFQRNMEQLGQEMHEQRQEYTRLIRKQGDNFARAMQKQRRELQGQIRDIQAALIRKEAGERDQAKQWLNDAERFLDMIGSEYRHEKFKPGVLNRIRNEIAISQGNLDQGNFQAAIASAQQSFLRSSELRLELEQLEMEWEAHLEAARRNVAEVLATCDAQTVCRLTFETEQGAEEVAGEVDFWTEGALSDLRKRAEEQLKRLGKPDDMSLDDLKRSISQSEKWRGESLELAERAKEALLASQLRNNIGQVMEKALSDAGWEITDATYEGEDFRRSVHVKMENLQGDEIVTIITPEAGADTTIQNRVNVSFFDRSTNDEAFRQERLKAITGVLQEEGMECTPPVCRPGTEDMPCEDPGKLDFEQVKRATQTTTPTRPQGR